MLPNSIWLNLFGTLFFLSIISALIWFAGPDFSWGDVTPLFSPEKRFYVIASLFLIGVLKFILLDLDMSNAWQAKDEETRKKIETLQSRFFGALDFLKKTVITKHNKQVRLNQLPWYLLIGPPNAGKTTLLAHADVNYILQRQFQNINTKQLTPSEHCDWWITRDVSIVDVPGAYMATHTTLKNRKNKMGMYPFLWRFFLRLIKNHRGKQSIDGIIIALPIPEMIQQGDYQQYQALLRNLLQRIFELQKFFSYPIPAYMVITKCDLLPGFAEFFAESSNDEITQAWGVSLSPRKKNEKLPDIFLQQFNALIKKLNQQLIWRLHHERDSQARPAIKDFPLQVELLKEFTLEFIKKFSTGPFSISLQGVYLTSATQTENIAEAKILDEVNSDTFALQIFKEPMLAARAYFVKQFIAQGIFVQPQTVETSNSILQDAWVRYLAYTTSVAIVGFAAILLGKDFEKGINKAYSIQNNLANYQLSLQHVQSIDDHLLKTLDLLNSLQKTEDHSKYSQSISYLTSFYSYQSKEKANAIYHQALVALLLPEIRDYLADYLRSPVNKNADYIYAALKSYLMFNDPTHMNAEFIINTMQEILPKTFSDKANFELTNHLNRALHTTPYSSPINLTLVQEMRRFFLAMQTPQLSYIILKNINDNNVETEINFGTTQNAMAFVSPQSNQIPTMFTVKAFNDIYTHQIAMAVNEAVSGNWVLGTNVVSLTPEDMAALVDQVRTNYINNYVDIWESMLANVHLNAPKNLQETDSLIINLISNDSPLLQLLQTIHANTYFSPFTTMSPKLEGVGSLVDKNKATNDQLYQIFSGLQSLHQYIAPVALATNQRKAAFDIISKRIANHSMDPITQLRLIAQKSPEPIKNWLEDLTNNTWHLLMKEAGHYINTSWQENVMQIYQTHIANRYPFSNTAQNEVDLDKFTDFFGNPGVVYNFYNQYLQDFVDASTADWHWKTIDNDKFPFAEDSLRQIQLALQIHRLFFPNGDNKLFVQFAVQPYKIGNNIKTVKLNINAKEIVDEKNNTPMSHLISWPRPNEPKITSIQLVMNNNQIINRDFSGDWGWYKLINQSFENILNKKSFVINLSANENSAKYLVFSDRQSNPFLAANFSHFKLPTSLVVEQR